MPLLTRPLEWLRGFWRTHRHPGWLFPGTHRPVQERDAPMGVSGVQKASRGALRESGVTKPATLHRFVQHVLPRGFVQVRDYGLGSSPRAPAHASRPCHRNTRSGPWSRPARRTPSPLALGAQARPSAVPPAVRQAGALPPAPLGVPPALTPRPRWVTLDLARARHLAGRGGFRPPLRRATAGRPARARGPPALAPSATGHSAPFLGATSSGQLRRRGALPLNGPQPGPVTSL